MALDTVSGEELREWLGAVNAKESAEWLMLAIAYDRGTAVSDLADWYGHDESEIREWLDRIESEPLVVAVAELEGVDVDALADSYGLAPNTIREWFETLETASPEEAVSVIDRYSRRSTPPVVRETEAVVTYLNYDAIEEHGWSISDEDLFGKASAASLADDEYGRIVVEPGETILEAAENRGLSWPYACRGGACANCAALVREGDIAMPGNHVLAEKQVSAMNARLTCVGVPVTDEVKLIMNVQHLDQFENLRLPSPLSGSGWSAP